MASVELKQSLGWLVTLPLARRKGQTIDRVYWLEALLAPLAYAPYFH